MTAVIIGVQIKSRNNAELLALTFNVLIIMTNNNFSSTAAFLWSVADLLRGDFKQSQYGRIILPFTLLRRLECVLEGAKGQVLDV